MTQRDGRRLLYTAEYVEGFRNALHEARADLHEMHCRHLDELADLRAELSELRSIFADVVGTLRQQADSDVARLRRDLERALLRLAPPDGKPLN
jgi:hypothetical protein